MMTAPGKDILFSIAATAGEGDAENSLIVEMAISIEDLNEIRAIADDRKIGVAQLTADVLRGRASSWRADAASLESEAEQFRSRATALDAAAAHIDVSPDSLKIKVE